MNAARRLTWAIFGIAALALIVTGAPFVAPAGTGPVERMSVRGEVVLLLGNGPYRHMPDQVAIQGPAQDLVTLFVGLPLLLISLFWARTGSRAGHLMLTSVVGYLFVQYVLYLAMATYNELFLVWVGLVLLTSQVLARLLLAQPAADFAPPPASGWPRIAVGAFLIAHGLSITLLWLSVIVPPLLDGSLYPDGLAHFATMIVQGIDLALFLPPSVIAGVAYLRRMPAGGLLAPVYGVFLSLQMTAMLAKIIWMSLDGVPVGPPLAIIPFLLAGAVATAVLTLRANIGTTAVKDSGLRTAGA